MRQTDLLIGILSCKKNIPHHRHLRETWLSKMPRDAVKHLFIVGNPGYPDIVRNDVLYLDCDDSYEELPRKVLRFFSYAHNNLRFNYILKCDDDSFVSPAIETIPGLQAEHFITGRLLRYTNTGYKNWLTSKGLEWRSSYERFLEGLSSFPCGGEGYLLSRHAVQLAIDADTENKDTLPPSSEDIVITQFLSRKGVRPTVIPHMSTTPSKLCKEWFFLRPDCAVIIHPVLQAHMPLLQNRHLLTNKIGIVIRAFAQKVFRRRCL